MAYQSGVNKIDAAAVLGLSGTYNSLAYRVHEIEKHFHNIAYIYGAASNAMALNAAAAFRVTGGDNAWGTELLLTDGTVIESGSSTKRFDLHRMYVNAVETANILTIVHFRSGVKGTPIAGAVTEEDDDTFTSVAHGLVDGDTVILSSIVDTTGINTYTVYYVVSKTDNTFKLSLTSGGGAVNLTTDGTATVTKLTMTELTSSVVSMPATNSDAHPYHLLCPRKTCDTTISVRALCQAGSSKYVDFLLGLHTYEA